MMSWQAKLALEVLWQKGVKAGDRQDMQHTARCPEHEDVVLQQPLHRFGKVCETNIQRKKDINTK